MTRIGVNSQSVDLDQQFTAYMAGNVNSLCEATETEFNQLAQRIFAAQFETVAVYRQFCQRRKVSPERVRHWSEIPPFPARAFKEFEVSSIPPSERTAVFYSSGTSQQERSRHFHHAKSLAVYETSLRLWFERNFQPNPAMKLVFLSPENAPNSSLVHMFKTVQRHYGGPESLFTGAVNADASWSIDMEKTMAALKDSRPIGLLGTAFSFVHLLDFLETHKKWLCLPRGSRVMETGGYKGRSREMPKAQLHGMISEFLGVAGRDIVTEYGMSELSSQAYACGGIFEFPSWARAAVISPETGREAADGETGLLRVFDLANIYSVMAVQTEDLAVRRGSGFELLGRAADSGPRGCSLMAESKNGR